ncbi:MAG: hypothetical protein HYZ28_05775 [Myxococcales bacterium]|nr:hypothetical protein [Myxococcales bacterium]
MSSARLPYLAAAASLLLASCSLIVASDYPEPGPCGCPGGQRCLEDGGCAASPVDAGPCNPPCAAEKVCDRARCVGPRCVGVPCASGWACADDTGICTGPGDSDGDGVADSSDVCPSAFDPAQQNADGDPRGDACDCRPADPAIYEGNSEACDGKDNDCDGAIDEGLENVAPYWYQDQDGDGYGFPGNPVRACVKPAGRVDNASDCNDADPLSHPDAGEWCDGRDHDCNGSWEVVVPQHCASIQQALDAAADAGLTGDAGRITVLPGVYGPIDFRGARIAVVGRDGPAVTVLDGADAGPVVTFASGETEDSLLSGFTVRNGRAVIGAGIYVRGASPTLDRLVIENNVAPPSVLPDGGVAYEYGGGAYFWSSDSLVRRTVFRSNQAAYSGGGLYASYGALKLQNVVLDRNRSVYGGGIATSSCWLDAKNVVAVKNSASRGGAAYFLSASPSVQNATLVDNTATGEGGGILVRAAVYLANTTFSGGSASDGGAVFVESGQLVSDYSNYFGNSPNQVAGAPSPVGVNGNISAAPGFLSQSGSDPSQWNLRLQSGSALRGAGAPTLLNPDGGRSDIGAYGGPGGDDW